MQFENLRAVGFRSDGPYVRFSDFCWSFDCPRPGSEIEFLNLTLKVMNATATILRIDATIDDAIIMVSNGSADFTLVTAIQTLDRMNIVDFTTPIGFTYYGYIHKEIPELAVADYILNAFYVDTLALLILLGIIVGSLIFLYTKIFNVRKKSLIEWMLVACSGILRQFMFRISTPICAIILIGVWLLCCQVIITYYEAKLKSFLLLSQRRGTIFNDLDDVLNAVEHDGWIMVLQDQGYTPYMFCKKEQCERLDRLSNKFLNISSEENIIPYLELDKHVGFIAFTSDVSQTRISYFNYEHRILFVRDGVMAPEFLAYAVPKTFPELREKFNRALAITKDSYGTIQTRYLPAFIDYSTAVRQNQNVTVLETTHFIQLYKFLLILYGIAVIILLLELSFRWIIRYYYLDSDSYRFVGFDWRFLRPQWQYRHFPRNQTIVLPMRRSHSPIHFSFKPYYATY
ncbi:unnamed protein product [Caenorhabditis bovis]|uniref:Uncharacterized protein n=1 Tax=Caenorhabditis bovis TaxID=2654633 RepID=A0A8S1EWM0_9PELO|nr:unnamed protein product [Caenorhabditis bovis]